MVDLFVLDDSDRFQMESQYKGVRSDLYVKIDELYYNFVAYEIDRLKMEFEISWEKLGYYLPSPIAIVVRKIDLIEIEKVVGILADKNFFARFMPLTKKEVEFLDLIRV